MNILREISYTKKTFIKKLYITKYSNNLKNVYIQYIQ